MNVRNNSKGFTLVEVLTASILSCITLACIVQFFLTQLNQYRLISGNNQLSENLRIFSKFFEKDTHNALAFYVFENLDAALNFKKTDKVTTQHSGNCVLFVEARGIVSGGQGTLYYVGEKTTRNGQSCYPLYRAVISFNNSKINERKNDLKNLSLAYLKETPECFTNGIFYISSIRKFTDTPIAGCRHGLYTKFKMIEPGLKGQAAETLCNFAFYARNPRFIIN